VTAGFRAVYYLLLSRLRLSRVDAVSMRLYNAGDARVEDFESSVPSVFIPAHRSAIQFPA
jgi:hypothetical protein